MPAPGYSRVKLSFGGTIGTDQDWSYGLTVADPDGWVPSQAALTSYLGDVRTALNDLYADASGPIHLMSTDTVLNVVRGYAYAAGSSVAATQAELPAGPFAGPGGKVLPTQTALVVSLRTGANGRHYRGRCYLPCTGETLTSYQIVDARSAAISTDFAAFITAINDIVVTGATPQVIVPNSIGDFGTNVTSVVVNSRVDIQRRRADKVASLYSHQTGV